MDLDPGSDPLRLVLGIALLGFRCRFSAIWICKGKEAISGVFSGKGLEFASGRRI